MDQLIEMYVEDRNKLNTLFLSHDSNDRNDHSSNNNNDNNDRHPPPPPPQPPNSSSNNNNYSNLPDTSTGDVYQSQQQPQINDTNSSKLAHKCEPLPKMSKLSFNLLNLVDQSSEPNTPVSRNPLLDRPMQRGNSDLIPSRIPSRIIATGKHAPLIRIETEQLVSSAQLKKQLQELHQQQQYRKLIEQQQSLISTMHDSSNAPQQIESTQSASQQQQQQQEEEFNNEFNNELPLSAHPVTSSIETSTLDYSRRMPSSTISHSISFPVGTSALLTKKSGQCKHCTQIQLQDSSSSNFNNSRIQQSQRTTFYRQMTYPHSSTLFTQAFTHQLSHPQQPPLPPQTTTSINTITSSTFTSRSNTQSTNTLVHHHHHSNHPSADHI